jgi:cyclic 2,3-diphosphoglycerate synthetase
MANSTADRIEPLTGYRALAGRRVLCLVDGQHYPAVIRAVLETMADRGATPAGLLFLGGTEKIDDPREALAGVGESVRVYLDDAEPRGAREAAAGREAARGREAAAGRGALAGRENPRRGATDAPSAGDAAARSPDMALEARLSEAIADCGAEVVADLSDAPVLDYSRRYRLVTRCLFLGIPYVGADFSFEPPLREKVFSKPSLAIIGTGKRIGKTAVSIHIGRLLDDAGLRPVIVTMGRGGPREPEVIEPSDEDPVERLLSVAQSGRHAASDYWEDSILSAVPTVGCRRCGGGLFGSPFDSNVIDGVRRAESREENFVIVEGSGPTAAPVHTDRTVLVSGAATPIGEAFDGLARYRLLASDAVVFTGCEPPFSDPEYLERLDETVRRERGDIPIFHTRFVPEPSAPIEGKNVFLATTVDPDRAERVSRTLEQRNRCRVSYTSCNLSNRETLRAELAEHLEDCDVLVTEVKAASIDVAAETARDRGKEIVLMHNAIEHEELDAFILGLAERP